MQIGLLNILKNSHHAGGLFRDNVKIMKIEGGWLRNLCKNLFGVHFIIL